MATSAREEYRSLLRRQRELSWGCHEGQVLTLNPIPINLILAPQPAPLYDPSADQASIRQAVMPSAVQPAELVAF